MTRTTITRTEFVTIFEGVKKSKDEFDMLSTKQFKERIKIRFGIVVSDGVVEELRSLCDLKPKRGIGPTRQTPMHKIRRLTAENVRVFRLLGVPDHELQALRDFANGRPYDAEGGENNGA